jgi:hypothetical protein
MFDLGIVPLASIISSSANSAINDLLSKLIPTTTKHQLANSAANNRLMRWLFANEQRTQERSLEAKRLELLKQLKDIDHKLGKIRAKKAQQPLPKEMRSNDSGLTPGGEEPSRKPSLNGERERNKSSEKGAALDWERRRRNVETSPEQQK